MFIRILAILWALMPIVFIVMIMIDHASGGIPNVNDIVPSYLN